MIKLYFAPNSRALRILWLLEEMGQPYEIEILDLEKQEHKSAKMLAINPMGKVPTVEVNGKAVWESPAIVAHFGDLYPEAGLAPAVGTPARADYYRWLSFGTAVMEPAFMDHIMSQKPNPSAAGWGSFESMKLALAQAIQPGPWVLGANFSGADIIIGSNLNWFFMWKKDSFVDVPGIEDYVSSVQGRPAFKRSMERNEEILASFKK